MCGIAGIIRTDGGPVADGDLRILRDSRRCRRESQRSRSGQCTRKSHSKLFRHVRSNPLKIPPDVAVAV